MALNIKVDEDECIGCGECAESAPNTFEVNDDNIVEVKDPGGDDEDTIVEAAKACPTEALIVTNDAGEQLAP
jgi:ferredoxin